MNNTNGNVDFNEISGLLNAPGGKVLLGIDGYIAEVWQVVLSRASREDYRLFEKMTDLGESIMKCGGGGYSNEILRKRRTYGGFTTNTGKAVSRLGVTIEMLGMFGTNGVDPVFREFADKNRLISVGEPGISIIYEFVDGKIMFVYVNEIMGFTWDSLIKAYDEEKLKKLYLDADVIAVGYWSLFPAFDEIVGKLCGFGLNKNKKQRMFFDFADIRKSDRAPLDKTLALLAELNKDIPMTLSLNEHEAALLYSYHGEVLDQREAPGAGTAEKIRAATGLTELVVHTPYYAASVSVTDGYAVMPQHYCEAPVITTGAGDNFNGGYLAAMLKGLPPAARLQTANATTYLYVSRGYSPELSEVLEEIKNR